MKRFLSVLLIALCLVAFVSPAHAFHGVRMTYAASGSSGITVADNDNIDFGTGNFTLRWKGSLPDWSNSAGELLWKVYSGVGYDIEIASSIIKLFLGNGTGNYLPSSTTHSITNGTTAEITIVVTRETASVTGSVIFYVNGSKLGNTITIPIDGANINNARNLYISGDSSSHMAGAISSVTLFNRALSAAEVLSLYQNGIADADKWGSQIPIYHGIFSAGVDGWTGSGATVAGNIDTDADAAGVPPSDDWLRIISSGGGSAAGVKSALGLAAGNKVEITITYFIPSTNTTTVGFVARDSNASAASQVAPASITLDAETTVTLPVMTIASGTGIRIYQAVSGGAPGSTAGDKIYIKNVSVRKLGATLDLEPSGIGATNVYTSNYSAGADSMQSSGGTGAGNVDGILGQDDTFKYYADGTTTSHVLTRNMLTLGKIYRVNFDYHIPSANTNVKKIRVRPGDRTTDRNGNSVYGTVTGQWANITAELATTSGSDNYLEIDTMNNAYSVNYTGANSSSDDILYIKNLKVDDMSWQDSSSNNLDGTMPDVGWNILNMGPFMSTPTLFRPIWNKPVWRYISAP